MGYRGKLREREAARALRRRGETLLDIAEALGVAKSSVSLWVRDVEFVPRPRARGRRRGPNVLQRRKAAEIERLLAEGRERIGVLAEREFLVAGAALYAGEGAKDRLKFANTSPEMIGFFCRWLRYFFEVDESRLRGQIYLHEGLDIDAATAWWSEITGIPTIQFRHPYRAVADPSLRTTKHERGCAYVIYDCRATHRAVMGLVEALLTSQPAIPG
ncbi:MAG: hypothetical protein QOE35_1696 [Actinomycetota bacterium]